ncbi:ATP-binding protein [Paradesertivirga mongoliensis]|uniref:ATP-binding protein n=1 Tax=Paradesertivirga mongoliensis TaxID=2100740 RepID=A0ABW4ZMF9_9SPHI
MGHLKGDSDKPDKQRSKVYSSGGSCFKVVLSSSINNKLELTFDIHDTGIGIPEEKSFSQVDNTTARKYGGTALGLVISERLAELMGGTVWVNS